MAPLPTRYEIDLHNKLVGGTAHGRGAGSSTGDGLDLLAHLATAVAALGVGTKPVWISTVDILAPALKGLNDGSALITTAALSANAGWVVPITAPAGAVINRAWWWNGDAVAGNVDVAIYDEGFNRVASTGAVAASGPNALQSAALTSPYTLLASKGYYMAISQSSGSQQFTAHTTSTSRIIGAMGVMLLTSSHPLPSTITPAAFLGTTQVAIFGLSNRTTAI